MFMFLLIDKEGEGEKGKRGGEWGKKGE